MPDIAALSVAVTADTTGLEAGLARANQQVSGFGSQLSGIGTIAGAAFAGLGVAAATGIGAAVKSAADFEKQISNIAAVSGEGAEGIDKIRQTALQLGKDTSFSASEAAAGMEEIIKAGLSVEQVVDGAGRAVLDLSAASGTAVEESARIMSNVLNTFSADQLTAGQAANFLTGAANASATSVHELGYGLASVGNVAATMGLSFADTNTALAAFAQNGLKGSDAGTSLKTMLLNLTPQTDKQISAMSELGLMTVNSSKAMEQLRARGIDPTNMSTGEMLHSLQMLVLGWDGASKMTDKQTKEWEKASAGMGLFSNAFFDAAGNTKSLADISGILQNALKGLTKEEQINALQTIFGTDAIRAAAIMAKLGTEGFNEMAGAVKKQGDAQAIAAQRLDNVLGSWEKFKGSVETAAIMLGSLFLPAIKGVIDGLTDFANEAIEAIDQIPDAVETVRQVIAGDWAPDASIRPFTLAVGEAALMLKEQFGAAVETVADFITGTLAPAVRQVGQFFAEHTEVVQGFAVALGSILTMAGVQAVLTAIGAAIALLVSPIGLVVAAITLLTAAWIGNWGGMRDIVTQAWAAIQPVLTQLVDWLGVQIPAVLQWLSDVGLPALVTAGQAVSAFVTGTLVPALTTLVDWLGPKVQEVTTWISGTGWPGLVTAGTAVGTMVTSVTAFFQALYTELDKRGVFTELQAIWDTLTAAGNLVWQMVQTAVGWWVKLHDALLPVQTDVGVLVGAGMLAKMATDTQAVGSAAQVAIDPIQVIGAGIKFMLDQVLAILAPLANFITALNDLKTLISNFPALPSFSMPGIPGLGGTGTQTLSYTTGGDVAQGDIADYIRQSAIRHHIDPETAIRVAMSEGGVSDPVRQSDFVYQGQREQSFGPFQLNMQGGMGNAALAAGIDPRNPAQWREAVDFALANAARGGWGPWHGAARAGIGNFQGIGTGPTAMPLNQMQKTLPPGMTGIGGPAFEVGGDANPQDWPGFMAAVDAAVPKWVESMATIRDTGTETFREVATVGTEQGQALVTASTDALGNVMRIYSDSTGVIGATITNAAGQIVQTWGTTGTAAVAAASTMATGVTEQTNLMASGALTSVTNLGTGILTTVQASSGTTIATVTDMQGQVTSQYATLANGAQLSMDGLAAGVMTSTTDLGTGVLTIMQDTSGNYIATVTDLAGNVVEQYTQLGADVVASATEQAAGTTEQAQTMATNVTGATQTMADDSAAAAVAMAEQIIADAQRMAEDTTAAADAMAADVAQALESLQEPVDNAAQTMESLGDVEISAPDVGDIVDAMHDVQRAAEKAAEAVDEVGDGDGGGDGGDDGEGRAIGGPVRRGTRYLVGEAGPEAFVPYADGTIIPNNRLGGGGGGGTTIVVNLNVEGSVTSERDLVEAVRSGLIAAGRRNGGGILGGLG